MDSTHQLVSYCLDTITY